MATVNTIRSEAINRPDAGRPQRLGRLADSRRERERDEKKLKEINKTFFFEMFGPKLFQIETLIFHINLKVQQKPAHLYVRPSIPFRCYSETLLNHHRRSEHYIFHENQPSGKFSHLLIYLTLTEPISRLSFFLSRDSLTPPWPRQFIPAEQPSNS